MPSVRFSDGTEKYLSDEEYAAAEKEAELLIISAKKDGYTEEEAKEMYSLRVLD